MAAALQTFGSIAVNFHPHVHALVTDGVFARDGTFERVYRWDQQALSELFRRLVLAGLRREQRLTEETHLQLLGWVHSGFSVHAGAPILPDDTQLLEHLARYLCRAPLRMDAVRETAKGVLVRTPPHPITGAREITLDPHELIRRLCDQIPPPRQHQVRYYGRYANRARGARRVREEAKASAGEESAGAMASRAPSPAAVPASASGRERDARADSPAARARRRSWGRLLRRIYEVDPLLCPKCRVQLRIVAFIYDEKIIDRIVRHLARTGAPDLFELRQQARQRAPPPA
jgi:hypothetical protein